MRWGAQQRFVAGVPEAFDELAKQLRAMGLETRILPVRFDRLRGHPAFGDDGFTPDGRDSRSRPESLPGRCRKRRQCTTRFEIG